MTRLTRVSMALLAVVLLAQSSWAAESVRVTADRVNLRSAPGTDSRIVAKVNRGAILPVLGREGSWVRVTAPGGGAAYISASLCEPVPGASAPPAAAPSRAPEPEPSRSEPAFGRSGGSAEPFQLGVHASWASDSIDFGLGARASAGLPVADHVGVLATFDYFFGPGSSVTFEDVGVEVSGHAIQLGLYATYSHPIEGALLYGGAGLSHLRASATATAAVEGGPEVSVSGSNSNTSLGVVAGAKFKQRFFGELRYHFGDASHLTLSAGVLFDSPF